MYLVEVNDMNRQNKQCKDNPESAPCGIPRCPGIPGCFQNPDPGILKNLILGFFRIS